MTGHTTYYDEKHMNLEVSTNREVIVRYLSTDVFQNLMSLKMLSLFPDWCSSTLYRDGSSWACRTELDLKASGWNRAAYPNAKLIVLLDGNSPSMLQHALNSRPSGSVVLKVHDQWSRSTLCGDPRFVLTNSFLSYSKSDSEFRTTHVDTSMVDQQVEYNDEAAQLFAKSKYGQDEFRLHLSRGALWFSISDRKRIQSICLVYKNHGDIWEIGGVMTIPESRGRGLARSVVGAALKHIAAQKLIPRFQFHHHNTASRRLAESFGLELRLIVDHYVNSDQKLGQLKGESGVNDGG